jgi:glucose dehydrogenase
VPRAFSACLALACAGATVVALAGSTITDFPGTQSLLNASQDDANWILPAKTYSGNRYTILTQIDKSSVGHFREFRRL